MSEFKVCFTPIVSINPHENADALEIATVYGFQVVVKKDFYKAGDIAFYVPIDSVLPQDLEDKLFPPESKIKLHKHRVKQIRIRKFASQGMVINKEDIQEIMNTRGTPLQTLIPEYDYAEAIGITKYEPPAPDFQSSAPGGRKDKPLTNPLFHTYNGLDNLKWFPTRFKDNEEVVVQEKLHGTNARFGLIPTAANTLWKKVLKFFGMLPKYEYVYGSNNVELTNRKGYKGFYGSDLYGKTFDSVDARTKVREFEIIYGEIIGEGIQKNYNYGHRDPHFVLFDVKIMNSDGTYTWLQPDEVEQYALERGFTMIPVLYKGKFDLAHIKTLTEGDSVYCPRQKVREGVVIKSRLGYNDEYCSSNKRALKVISEKYLDKDQTDFH